MPRSPMRSPSRCRNTSPRDLAISRMPIVSPSSRSGRGRRGRIVGLRSEVGSSKTVMWTSLHPPPSFPRKREPRAPRAKRLPLGPRFRGGDDRLSGPHLLGYRKAAAGSARGPAGNDAGKHAGIATGADDHNPAGAELVDGFAGDRGRPAFGDTLGAGREVLPGNLAQPIELVVEPGLGPAGILEGAMMLWAHHQQRVACGRMLDIAEGLQRSGKAARQALGVARFLVDDTLQTVAGEH